jgi:hypothetical protein
LAGSLFAHRIDAEPALGAQVDSIRSCPPEHSGANGGVDGHRVRISGFVAEGSARIGKHQGGRTRNWARRSRDALEVRVQGFGEIQREDVARIAGA